MQSDKLIKDDLVKNILTTFGDALPSQPGVGCDADNFKES